MFMNRTTTTGEEGSGENETQIRKEHEAAKEEEVVQKWKETGAGIQRQQGSSVMQIFLLILKQRLALHVLYWRATAFSKVPVCVL